MKTNTNLRTDVRETLKSVMALHFRATNKCLTLEQREEVMMDLGFGIDELRGMLNLLEKSAMEATKS